MSSSKGYFQRVHEQTATKFWINNPSRAQADLSISHGAQSATMNPAYMGKMLSDPVEGPFMMEIIKRLVKQESDDTRVLELLQTELVMEVAKKFLPIYEATGGQQGYVSIQGDPFNEHFDAIYEYGKYNASKMPNITPKIPAIPDGIKALEALAAEGIPLNATEIFAMDQFVDVGEAYLRANKGKKHRSVMFYSHIAGIFDEYIQNYVADNNVDIPCDITWQAGIAVARKMYALCNERGYGIRMISGGARGLNHFTEMVGAEANITINWVGTADKLIELDGPVVQRFFQPTPESVNDELCRKLPDYRAAYMSGGIAPENYEEYGPVQLFFSGFRKNWKLALEAVAKCRSEQA